MRVSRAVAAALALLVATAEAGRAASAGAEGGWFEAILAAREAEAGRAVDSGQRASVLARMAGLEAPHAIGDSAADLVFTPLAPCRVVDTRAPTAGILVAGTPREFVVAGDGALFASQGGQAGGCGVPVGATAAMLNLVATGSTGMGHLRAKAWAAGTPVMPNASIINFGIVSGLNALANGLALPICDPAAAACTYDLHVQSSVSNAHLVADVVGYFSSVEGVLTGAEAPLEVTGSNVRLSTTGCAAGHVWKYTGSGWTCAADENTTYSAGAGLSLSGSTIGLSTLGCVAGYVWKYNGLEWRCRPDVDTNTTYSAGAGLLLTGTTLSIDRIPTGPFLNVTVGSPSVSESWGLIDQEALNPPANGHVLAIATGDLGCPSPCAGVSVTHILTTDGTTCDTAGIPTTDYLRDSSVRAHPTVLGVFPTTAGGAMAVRWCARVSDSATFASPTVSNGKIALVFIPD
jgi:hypothetical protein